LTFGWGFQREALSICDGGWTGDNLDADWRVMADFNNFFGLSKLMAVSTQNQMAGSWPLSASTFRCSHKDRLTGQSRPQ
jgi:hypothetical protein